VTRALTSTTLADLVEFAGPVRAAGPVAEPVA
jgi:hypothetical protein